MRQLLVIILVYVSVTGAQKCIFNQVRCGGGSDDRCIPVGFVCDGGGDCDDDSDEDEELCSTFSRERCSSSEAYCTRTAVGDARCVGVDTYCNTVDPPCEGDLDRRVCSMLQSGQISSLDNFPDPNTINGGNFNRSHGTAEEFSELLANTLSSDQCPLMYTQVGDQCLSFFHVGDMNWAQSREFCKHINGDLMTFRNVSQFTDVIQRIQKLGLSTNFWIGGHLRNGSEGWTWIDDTPMELGSPYWATRYSNLCLERNVTSSSGLSCSNYYQAPETNPQGNCVSLNYEHFFQMSDEDCLFEMSPLCVYQGPAIFRRRF